MTTHPRERPTWAIGAMAAMACGAAMAQGSTSAATKAPAANSAIPWGSNATQPAPAAPPALPPAARVPAAATLHIKRPSGSALARVGAATQAPGAALRMVDAASISELRGLDTATLVRSGEAAGVPARSGHPSTAAPASTRARTTAATDGGMAQVPLSPRPDTARSAQAIDMPCTQAQAAFANGSTHYLSTVNKRPKDFWINLDADERHLLLSGCFDKTPGEVRVQGNFPNGYVKANVVLWEERVIVAVVPPLTGIADQDISVRVMLAGGRSTNERIGHLWAKREDRVLDDLSIFASSGDCVAKVFRGESGPGLIAYYPPKYPEGESSRGPLYGKAPAPSATCALPQGAATPSGVTHFKSRLAPGWELVSLSLHPLLGAARHEWVGDSDFDVRWTAASFTASHATVGIPTGSELFHALGFSVDQVVLRGPAGTSPTGR